MAYKLYLVYNLRLSTPPELLSSCLCHGYLDMYEYASLWTSWKLMCDVKHDLPKDFDLINRRIMRDSSIKPSTETIKWSQASRCWLSALSSPQLRP